MSDVASSIRAATFSAWWAVLYEMIGGKRAFEGKTLVSVAAAILEKDPAPIRTLQPTTPPALERAIKKNPDARWQSARDLASELKWMILPGMPMIMFTMHDSSLILKEAQGAGITHVFSKGNGFGEDVFASIRLMLQA